MPLPALIEAPSRSCSSAILIELRLLVPSSSSAVTRPAVPSFALSSAALPASKATDTRTTGTVARRAKRTRMPFFNVACSTAGYSRSLTGSIAGSVTLVGGGGASTEGAGFFGSRKKAGRCVALPASALSSAERSPGATVRRNTGRPSHFRAAALTDCGSAAA